jgi:hypothetical protein
MEGSNWGDGLFVIEVLKADLAAKPGENILDPRTLARDRAVDSLSR